MSHKRKGGDLRQPQTPPEQQESRQQKDSQKPQQTSK